MKNSINCKINIRFDFIGIGPDGHVGNSACFH